MLTLPSVTYVMMETRSHAMARVTMEDCLSKVTFGDVLLLTDKIEAFQGMDTSGAVVRNHVVPDWPTKEDWCRASWFTVPPLIRTEHILFCQWDAGVWDPKAWRPEFLAYDYIGALWQWHPNKRVGNSGFCLKSTRLARYLYDRRAQYPCDTQIEDDLLCRTYRTNLEGAGFEWAPEKLAHEFAYEGCGPDPRPVLASHFGFHGAFNFVRVFDMAELERRATIMASNAYIRDSYMMDGLKQSAPQITVQAKLDVGSFPTEIAVGQQQVAAASEGDT